MKRFRLDYLAFTRGCVLLAVLVGVLDFVGAMRCTVGGVMGNVLRDLAQIVGAAQVVPVAGLLFLPSRAPWTRAPKALWTVWLAVASPILLLGAFVAVACRG